MFAYHHGPDEDKEKYFFIINRLLSKKYPKDYIKQVKKTWRVNGEDKTVHYLTYKRPIQTYINAAAKYGLLVSQVAEPTSTTKFKGKKKSSPVPSSMIVKAVKITT